MIIKQQIDCSVSIRRFDNKEQIDFVKDTVIDVDEDTGNYLLSMKCFDENGNLQTDLIEVK